MDAAAVEAELAKMPAPPAAEAIELGIDDEGVAVGLFLALDTQWRTAGMTGVLQGLDYQAIEPTARLLGLALNPAAFHDLRVLEAEALKALAEKRG